MMNIFTKFHHRFKKKKEERKQWVENVMVHVPSNKLCNMYFKIGFPPKVKIDNSLFHHGRLILLCYN